MQLPHLLQLATAIALLHIMDLNTGADPGGGLGGLQPHVLSPVPGK